MHHPEAVGFSGSQTRTRTVGIHPGNNFQSIAEAFEEITKASRTKHNTLELRGNIVGQHRETEFFDAMSHINVNVNGYHIRVMIRTSGRNSSASMTQNGET